MVDSFRDKLIKVLVDGQLIKQKDIDKALETQKRHGGSIGKILIGQGAISQKSLLVIMSQELGIPLIDLSKFKISKDIIKLIPENVAKQYSIVPISKIGKVLTVAMSDPLNMFAIDDMELITNFRVDPVIATEDNIRDTINTYYSQLAQGMSEIAGEVESSDVELVGEDRLDISEITEESKSAPIVKVVGLMLNEALRRRASDIHIEPSEKYLKVRYRIDGSMHDVLTLPKKNQNAVVARIKILSRLDITETRMPQDGRFRISYEGKEIDFRVSVLPITFGGKIVLRILDRSSLSIGLDKLGFLPGPLGIFKTALARPYGMLLLTGPTGSGKSTTLYSIINQLNTPDRNIITLEDPVEYELEGITQMQVKPEIGLTFVDGLKSVLRQSPDIIMVGEIRDFETADIAIKASLTGQLILSTLHTNDAVGAITRLIDMGVEPFLLSSSLILTAAQRLMRKICSNCKEEVSIPKNALERQGLNLSGLEKKGVKAFYQGKGCSKCNNTGYFGRFGILETILIDDEIRNMIMDKTSGDRIKEYCVKRALMTLRDNALENFINGVTTLDEVLSVTFED